MSADLLDFIQAHQIENPIVVGHSMGGKVAMLFAGRYYLTKVAALVVVDIAPKYYPLHHQAIFAGLQAIDLRVLSTRQEADAILSGHIPEADVRQFLLKNLYRNAQGGFAWRMNLQVLDRAIANVGEAFPDNLKYAGRTLFIRGAKSKYISDEDRTVIHQYFPQAMLETIENAGHWVQAEQPQAFLACLRTFLEN
jgi:pimeloyl-ACP methyl ester carboxylesterase